MTGSILLLWALIAFYLATGLYVALLPHDFYLNAPGAAATGPYNMHFIRDVGFAFLTSAIALGYGMYSGNKPLMLGGALWLLLHGLFHLALWILHGMQLNSAALTDAAIVIAPAFAMFALCLRHRVA
ncbi:MAG: hypothetical protein AAGE43_15695 [Pseudomonadota bacterium]